MVEVSHKIPPYITHSPCHCFEISWVALVFIFSSFLSAFMRILPSLSSAVGSPFLFSVSSILLTFWQKLVSYLQKLFILLHGHMTRLHLLVFPTVRGEHITDSGIFMDWPKLITPCIQHSLQPCLSSSSGIKQGTTVTLKYKCWIWQSHNMEDS